MTQEEKAKAYDNLLIKLQKAKVDNNVCDERYCCVIDDIVPELKESEDEKIRKEIVRFIQMEVEDEIVGNKWLAWLEKQGEKGTNGNEREIPNSEQKPADKVEPKFHVGDIISDGISEVKIVSIDKNNYNVTNDEIENDAHAGNWVVYFKDQDNWKLVEQKPAEWSEEDKAVLDALIRRLEGEDVHVSPHLAAECLKSLQDRVGCETNCTTTWKPSDEQMDALRYVTNFDYGGHKATLVSLYEQLKKLKG